MPHSCTHPLFFFFSVLFASWLQVHSSLCVLRVHSPVACLVLCPSRLHWRDPAGGCLEGVCSMFELGRVEQREILLFFCCHNSWARNPPPNTTNPTYKRVAGSLLGGYLSAIPWILHANKASVVTLFQSGCSRNKTHPQTHTAQPPLHRTAETCPRCLHKERRGRGAGESGSPRPPRCADR